MPPAGLQRLRYAGKEVDALYPSVDMRRQITVPLILAPRCFLLRGVSMPIDQQPPHGLFLKWGRFQIGAFGIPAVTTVLIAVLLGFWGRWFGLW